MGFINVEPRLGAVFPFDAAWPRREGPCVRACVRAVLLCA